MKNTQTEAGEEEVLPGQDLPSGAVSRGRVANPTSPPASPQGAYRLLDLFCNAGGASVGYARAGFIVTGVDNELRHERRYPFRFICANVFGGWLTPDYLRANYDAIHASPPCQGYTAMRHAPGAKGAPLLIDATRALLEASGLPWIIENVEEAAWAMRDPITLCGTMFGLGAQGCELRRHRLFESNIEIAPPSPCQHTDKPVIGVYGGHARKRSAKHGGRGTRDVWAGGHRAAASEAMGMNWATLAEMSEAIPPAYTEWLGKQLLSHMETQRGAA